MSTETLCQRCQGLGLDTLFYGSYKPEKTEFRFGRLTELWAAETCHLCLLVKKILTAHYGKEYIVQKLEQGYDQHLSLYQNPLDLSFNRYAVSSFGLKVAFFVEIGCYAPKAIRGNQTAAFRRENRKRNDDRNKDWVMPCMFATKHPMDHPENCGTTGSIGQPGRLVDPEQVEWSLVRKWDSSCTHHGASVSLSKNKASSPGTDLRSQLRVIDVENACIVPLPPDASYIALSYQWGTDQKLKLKKENKARLEEPGYFDTSARRPSQTIVDAMTTTRELGYRYVWIDALCIVVCRDLESPLYRHAYSNAARRWCRRCLECQ